MSFQMRMSSSQLFKMGAIEAAVLIRDYLRGEPAASPDAAVRVFQDLGHHRGLDFDSGLRMYESAARDRSVLEFDRAELIREILWHAYIIERPVWGVAAPYGRQRVRAIAAPDDLQCLREADLYRAPASMGAQKWWAKVAALERADQDNRLAEIGATAEALTMEWEERHLENLGHPELKPRLVSIEDASLGFDVESYRLVEGNPIKHRIEVKGCSGTEIRFHLTRREWIVASSSPSGGYQVHVWVLDGPTLFVLEVEDVGSHVPSDKGNGRWETVFVTIPLG